MYTKKRNVTVWEEKKEVNGKVLGLLFKRNRLADLALITEFAVLGALLVQIYLMTNGLNGDATVCPEKWGQDSWGSYHLPAFGRSPVT
jgi:hypothetical protein